MSRLGFRVRVEVDLVPVLVRLLFGLGRGGLEVTLAAMRPEAGRAGGERRDRGWGRESVHRGGSERFSPRVSDLGRDRDGESRWE